MNTAMFVYNQNILKLLFSIFYKKFDEYYTCIQFAWNFPKEETEIMEDLTSQGVKIIFEINMKY